MIKEIYYKCMEYMPGWTSLDFWAYVLKRNKNNEPGLRSYFISAICRFKGHSCGVVWFRIGGFEPDMTCKNCGEDLG